MDRAIDKRVVKKRRFIRYLTYTAVIVSMVVALVSGIALKDNQQISIDEIQLSEVSYRPFEEYVTGYAIALPKRTYMLDAPHSGVIEEIYVASGVEVDAGSSVLSLRNPSAELSYLTQKAQLLEQANNIRNTEIRLRESQLRNESEMLDFRFNMENAKQQFHVDSTLYANNAIEKMAFENSRRKFRYAQERFRLSRERMASEQKLASNQLLQMHNSMRLVEENIARIEENLQSMTISAPIDGFCTLREFNVGESISQGQRIGQIDISGQFKLRAQIDEYYMTRLFEGQKAQAKIQDSYVSLTVGKVFDEVNGGQVNVDLHFKDSIKGITRGQNFPIQITLSAEEEVLTLAKGELRSSGREHLVYVVEDNGTLSSREVRIGRQNENYIEILSGLNEGERVVVSSYHSFDKNKEIVIADL